MADYGKKKNEELIALCKERGLPHTGKKADFVKRLEEYDAQQGGASASAPAAKPALEDEIDWDDEPATEAAKGATSEQAADAIAAGGLGRAQNPADVPNQTVVEDPTTTDDLTVAAAPEDAVANGDAPVATEEKAPEVDFSTGLAERTIEEDIEKRKARARKFGLPEDSDEIKALERAKRFGVTDASAVPGMLNAALSQGREKKRGLEAPLSEDAGVRKRGRGGRRGGRGGDRRERSRTPRQEGKKEGGGTWMSEADKARAEARKQRFAGQTSG